MALTAIRPKDLKAWASALSLVSLAWLDSQELAVFHASASMASASTTCSSRSLDLSLSRSLLVNNLANPSSCLVIGKPRLQGESLEKGLWDA